MIQRKGGYNDCLTSPGHLRLRVAARSVQNAAA